MLYEKNFCFSFDDTVLLNCYFVSWLVGWPTVKSQLCYSSTVLEVHQPVCLYFMMCLQQCWQQDCGLRKVQAPK